MKIKMLSFLVAAVLALTLCSQAKADSCTDGFGTGTLVYLGANNVGLGGSVTFCQTTSGSDTILVLVGDTGDLTNSGPLLFISQFDWDGTATFDSGTSSAGWSLQTNHGAADGFGKFDSEISNPGNDQGIGTYLEFTGIPGSIAVHAGFQNCTGWFTNADGATTNTNSGSCGGSDVPEPGTLLLFGSGALTLASYLRRKIT